MTHCKQYLFDGNIMSVPKDTNNNFTWDATDIRPWWNMMQRDGTWAGFFQLADHGELDFWWFYRLCSGNNVIPLFGSKHGATTFFGLIEDVQFATSRIHFVESKSMFGREGIRVAREFLRQLLTTKCIDGRPCFRYFLGETPSDNPLAVRFAKAIGFVEYARIEDGFYNPNTGRYCDKVLTKLSL